MGNVFGPPLALEALIAFFLESTFTGIYVFKRAKISPKFRMITAWLITLGTSISALWIITASGFMHNPVGYEMASDHSKVILTDIFTVLLNPYAWYMLIHTVASAMMLGGFFVLGVSSYKLLKKETSEEEKNIYAKASKIAAITALVTSMITPMIGNLYYAFVTKVQPSKIEAINGAMPIVKIAFLVMVLSGAIMILISLYTVIFHKRYLKSPTLQRIYKYIFILPYIAILAGWMVTEIGRQPWIVFNLLKTADAISQVPIASVVFSLVSISLLYVITFVVFIHLMKQQLVKSLDDNTYQYDGGNN
jgi:cytochrome d ubiquinol oxidase subunit I